MSKIGKTAVCLSNCEDQVRYSIMEYKQGLSKYQLTMLVLKTTDNCDGSQILTRFKIGVMNTVLFIFTDFKFKIWEK